MIELVIVSRLLEYPDAALAQHQQELFDALASSENLAKEDAQKLGVFLRDLLARDLLDAQADYSQLFDRGRATSLLLFEHVHGESRDRGQAMVDLMSQYEQHGLQLDSRELPDHLPLYLEYLAQLPKTEALGGLQDIAPILALLSGPDRLGTTTPAGYTDLLVSYTYRIAFEGGGGQDFGLAAAIATLIFLLVGALAIVNLKATRMKFD
jgi:nitrate reductase delta subunit